MASKLPPRIDIDLTIPVIVIGMLMAFVMPSATQSPSSLLKDMGWLVLAGFICVVAAKISLFRQGIWGSWGPRLMTYGWARLYVIGYSLMGVGILFVLMLYQAMR